MPRFKGIAANVCMLRDRRSMSDVLSPMMFNAIHESRREEPRRASRSLPLAKRSLVQR